MGWVINFSGIYYFLHIIYKFKKINFYNNLQKIIFTNLLLKISSNVYTDEWIIHKYSLIKDFFVFIYTNV